MDLQQRIDDAFIGDVIDLAPPNGEFVGPVRITKPLTIRGHGATIRAGCGPTVEISSSAVTLQELNIEVTGRPENLQGEQSCAIVVRDGRQVDFRDVVVRGNVFGVAEEEGVWRYPTSLRLKTIQSGVRHEFKVRLEVPVPCRVESEIAGVELSPDTLQAGRWDVTMRIEPLPEKTRLRGNLLVRSRSLMRRISMVASSRVDGDRSSATDTPPLITPGDPKTTANPTTEEPEVSDVFPAPPPPGTAPSDSLPTSPVLPPPLPPPPSLPSPPSHVPSPGVTPPPPDIGSPPLPISTQWPFDAHAAKRRQWDAAGTLGVEIRKPVNLGSGAPLKMVVIPPGEFLRGRGDQPDSDDRGHRVRISRSFYLGTTPVTQVEWQAIMGFNPSRFSGDQLPVESVSWLHVEEFLRRLSLQTSTTFRLCTEAEWEYACRAGTDSRFYFGDDQTQIDDYGWCAGNSQGQTQPVAQKKPSPWGLHDMHGNVWEWCADWYLPYPDGTTADPIGPPSGKKRVIRGGCWQFMALECMSGYRDRQMPDHTSPTIGFRLAADIPSPV